MIVDPRHLILGTAGHIDHGKTSLVKALTGTDTDRLPEEQRRGMTIELGFAELDLGDVRYGVVDVPGHEKFVRTMVAGATGIDVALLVVAADDSVMPQTIEHVEILDLLGVHRAVVAITKCDVVEPDLISLVADEMRGLLARTPMRAAPIVPVSALTGEGIAELKEVLHRIGMDAQARSSAGPFRMAIDRVFTIAGRGTVVTGSVLAGRVTAGEPLELHPIGATCRVRGVQSHGRNSQELGAGERAAVNLIGVERTAVERGFELATPGYLTPARLIDAQVTLLSAGNPRLRSPMRVRLSMGTTERMAKLVLLDEVPGSAERAPVFAQLRFAAPITAVYGQRFILRDEVATRTIGGGVVLRPVARRQRRAGASSAAGGEAAAERAGLAVLLSGGDADRVEEAWRHAGFATLTDLEIAARTGVDPARVPAIIHDLEARGRLVSVQHDSGNAKSLPRVTRSTWQALLERVAGQLAKFHAAHPDEIGCSIDTLIGWIDRKTVPGTGRAAFDRMVADAAIKPLGKYVALSRFAPSLSPQDERCLALMLDELRGSAFRPPTLGELQATRQSNLQRVARLAKLGVATGELVQIDAETFIHADAERQLRAVIEKLIDAGRPVTVAEVREATQSSRKFVVPLLEYLDRVGFTRRVGDVRVRAG